MTPRGEIRKILPQFEDDQLDSLAASKGGTRALRQAVSDERRRRRGPRRIRFVVDQHGIDRPAETYRRWAIRRCELAVINPPWFVVERVGGRIVFAAKTREEARRWVRMGRPVSTN